MSKFLFYFSGVLSSLAWTSFNANRDTAFAMLLTISLILWFIGEYQSPLQCFRRLYKKLFILINCKLLKNHKYEWWATGCSVNTGYYCEYCHDFKAPHSLKKKIAKRE